MDKKIKLGKYSLGLPRSRLLRVAIGLILIAGGLLGFLPVLGFWMIPLGLLVLSVDLPSVRKWRRRVQIWWGKRRRNASTHRARPGGDTEPG